MNSYLWWSKTFLFINLFVNKYSTPLKKVTLIFLSNPLWKVRSYQAPYFENLVGGVHTIWPVCHAHWYLCLFLQKYYGLPKCFSYRVRYTSDSIVPWHEFWAFTQHCLSVCCLHMFWIHIFFDCQICFQFLKTSE